MNLSSFKFFLFIDQIYRLSKRFATVAVDGEKNLEISAVQ